MTRIAIDLNVRVRGKLTYSGYEDVEGDLPADGAPVEVYEPESGLVGFGRLVDRDDERRLVYLQVDWSSLQIPVPFLISATSNPGGTSAGQREIRTLSTVTRTNVHIAPVAS